MVRKLFLIRHAEAEPSSNASNDFERRLTASGLRNAYMVGQYLKQENIKPDAVLSSCATRAKLTAETIANQLGFDLEKIQHHEGIFEASVRELLGIVHQLYTEKSTVFLVGHNPAITFLADYLGDAALADIKPGGVVQINFRLENWTMLDKGIGEFINYYDQVE